MEQLLSVDGERDGSVSGNPCIGYETKGDLAVVARDAGHGERKILRQHTGEALAEQFSSGAGLPLFLQELTVYFVQQTFVEGRYFA